MGTMASSPIRRPWPEEVHGGAVMVGALVKANSGGQMEDGRRQQRRRLESCGSSLGVLTSWNYQGALKNPAWATLSRSGQLACRDFFFFKLHI